LDNRKYTKEGVGGQSGVSTGWHAGVYSLPLGSGVHVSLSSIPDLVGTSKKRDTARGGVSWHKANQKEFLPNNAIVVEAHSALLNRLPTMDKQSYQRESNHWRGDPPSLVDGHPNENVHRVIAEKIVTQMVELPKKVN
jgi:hypothetical protein